MKKISLKGILIPSISLFLICLAVALLLSFTNELTKEPISKVEEEKKQTAMLSVCPGAVSFEEVKGIDSQAYVGVDDKGNVCAYAIPVTVKGYGGDMGIMVGISVKDEVTGVEILSHGETPGLGANCTNESFTDMYKRPLSEGEFLTDKDGGDIDAITGATITSRAVTDGVNQAVDIYNSIKGGEN